MFCHFSYERCRSFIHQRQMTAGRRRKADVYTWAAKSYITRVLMVIWGCSACLGLAECCCATCGMIRNKSSQRVPFREHNVADRLQFPRHHNPNPAIVLTGHVQLKMEPVSIRSLKETDPVVLLPHSTYHAHKHSKCPNIARTFIASIKWIKKSMESCSH